MNKLAQISIVVATCALPTFSHAQTYDKAHKLKAAETVFTWPTCERGGHTYGANGVFVLQYLLKNRGFYKSNPDGIFGLATEASVRKFQRAKGLKVDGIVGPQTWPILILRLKQGDKGDAVRALQFALRGFYRDKIAKPLINQRVDGVFGRVTYNNLRFYQDTEPLDNLTVDGIAGIRTWNALLSFASN